jgi:hypothetical protein
MKLTVEQIGQSILVESDSGKTYRITYAGFGDGDPDCVSCWECDCPAGRNDVNCKHLRAFLASRLSDYGDPYYEDDDLPSSIEV